MDTITFDDPPSILFVSMERASVPRFVELAHTLNHLQKFHCVVIHEVHLLLLNFSQSCSACCHYCHGLGYFGILLAMSWPRILLGYFWQYHGLGYFGLLLAMSWPRIFWN
jgi:hypothetical protein